MGEVFFVLFCFFFGGEEGGKGHVHLNFLFALILKIGAGEIGV